MSALVKRLFGAPSGGGGGGGGGQRQASPGVAIQKLRETEEMLNKKSEFFEAKIKEQVAIAKKAGTKNKRVALQALKRKKRFEKQLQQIDGTLSTIEFQREALENARSNTAVLESMEYAASALKDAHKHMDVDKVHDIMDDMQEAQELHDEISEAISQPVGFGADVDEDELLLELEELEQEQVDEQLLEIPADVLPSVPDTELPKPAAKAPAKTQEEQDLEELAAWAS